MTVFWLWATLQRMAAPAPVTIEGDTTCPSATEVALRFSSLLAQAAASAAGTPAPAADGGDRARIEMVDDAIEIVLRRADGTLIGRRRLPAQGACDARARVAAIVLATWESDVHPAFERAVAAPPEPSSPPPPLAVDVVKPMPPQPLPAGHARLDVGVGVSTSMAGGAVVAGARLAGALVSSRGFGVQVIIAGEGDRSTPAGSGQAIWSRYAAGAGPTYRRPLGAWAVDTNLTLVAALFRVHGEQYPVGYQSSGWDGGVAAGARLIAPGRAWRAWFAIDATRWLDNRDVREAISGQTRDIPSWTGSASLGFSYFGR